MSHCHAHVQHALAAVPAASKRTSKPQKVVSVRDPTNSGRGQEAGHPRRKRTQSEYLPTSGSDSVMIGSTSYLRSYLQSDDGIPRTRSEAVQKPVGNATRRIHRPQGESVPEDGRAARVPSSDLDDDVMRVVSRDL